MGCVSIWCSCRFSTFSALSVGLDYPAVTSRHRRMSAVNVPVGSGCVGVGPRVRLPTMKTNSALERGCPANKTSGVHCRSSGFMTPWDVCPRRRWELTAPCACQKGACSPFSSHPWIDGCLWCQKRHDMKNSSHDAIVSERQFCSVDALCGVQVTFPRRLTCCNFSCLHTPWCRARSDPPAGPASRQVGPTRRIQHQFP